MIEAPPKIPLSRLPGAFWFALRLTRHAGRREASLSITLEVVLGLLLPIQVLAGTWVVRRLQDSQGPFGFSEISGPLLAFAATFCVAQFLTGLVAERRRLLAELVMRTMQLRVAEKTISLDLAFFDSPSFYDKHSRASRESAGTAGVVQSATFLVSFGVAGVGLFGLIVRFDPLAALLAALALVPAWWAKGSSRMAMYRYSWGHSSDERRISYVLSRLGTEAWAKETRAFGTGAYLLRRATIVVQDRISRLRELVRRAMVRSLGCSIVSSALLVAAAAAAVRQYRIGETSGAALGTALAAILLFAQRANGLVTGTVALYERALHMEDYRSFLALPVSAVPAGAPALPEFQNIVVDGVSFRYPTSSALVLDDVSIKIRSGEIVALVGENGAGKTTLAKLLCGLYEPERGAIRWDERDLRDFDPAEVRRRIAVIFQDFVHYEFSARDNIGLGDVARIDDLDRVIEAARRAGADDYLASLPNGYESPLGRLFEGGRELSTGQWQRVALARAFFREAPLVVLDEPTAVLDARAEHELFQTLRDLFVGRTVLLISHRFSSVRMADRIFVLKHGRLHEQGTHEELIANEDLYAELFALQASNYRT